MPLFQGPPVEVPAGLLQALVDHGTFIRPIDQVEDGDPYFVDFVLAKLEAIKILEDSMKGREYPQPVPLAVE